MKWVYKILVFILSVWFIFLFGKFVENGRYQFHAFGTSEDEIVILDTRTGILFRLNDQGEWISSHAVEGAIGTWRKVITEFEELNTRKS